MQEHPGQFEWSQLRTLQRRIEEWRYLKGPSKVVMFRQKLFPGRQSQSDWTHCTDLGVTIQGQAYPHMFFHFMLPFSQWETGNLSKSESFESLTSGYVRAVRRLGAVPLEHRTDNLTAAVNNHERKHEFSPGWQDCMQYYGVEPTYNNAGEGHENGSVEKSHDLFKDALDQALMLRGSRDFASVSEYEKFVQDLLDQRNEPRRERLKLELAVMKALPVRDWSSPTRHAVRVNKYSTISVDSAVYSVPNRLIGARLRVLAYPNTIRAFFHTTLVAELPRQESGGHLIQWREVAPALLKKPGAFRTFVFRDDCFPSQIYREAHDALKGWNTKRADKEYLSVLAYAAGADDQEVQIAIELLLEAGQTPTLDAVKSLILAPTDKRADDVILSRSNDSPAPTGDNAGSDSLAPTSDNAGSDSPTLTSNNANSDSPALTSDNVGSDSPALTSDNRGSDSPATTSLLKPPVVSLATKLNLPAASAARKALAFPGRVAGDRQAGAAGSVSDKKPHRARGSVTGDKHQPASRVSSRKGSRTPCRVTQTRSRCFHLASLGSLALT
jgi:hypothetical protein